MKKVIYLVCVMIAASLTGFGQTRSRIPRPRQNQPAQPSSLAPTPIPAEGPRQTVEQPASVSQTYKPAIEYQYLMELRFYENQGGFLVEGLEVVFPPPGLQKATFVISRANGEVVNTVPLRLETPLASYTAFGMFLPDAVSGLAPIGEAGDYVLSVQIDGQPITSLPFSMKREASNDPFNPKNTFVREGPWRDLAHFSVTEEPGSHLEFSLVDESERATSRHKKSYGHAAFALRRPGDRGNKKSNGTDANRLAVSPGRICCAGYAGSIYDDG